MVEAIGINTPKTNFSEVTKNPEINYSQKNTPIPAKNYPVNFRKQNDSSQSKIINTNTLQMASLLVGTLASLLLIAYFAKNLLSFGKNRELLKQIKKANIPDNVRKKLMLEYDKLKQSDRDEGGIRNYIKNVLRLNWEKPVQKLVDIDKAKKILDEEMIGLESVKEEIISFCRMQNYILKNNIKVKNPLILCLDGPPGVGKTSIAQIIAKAMDLPFQRISLKSVSYSSYICGGDRIFTNAGPGCIIKALQNAKAGNPVILLDEIDKLGRNVNLGDPAAAFLDALEPEQCKNFTDINIELPYDLSNVTFIVTSNDLSNIPEVLKDRLEILHLPAYGVKEKTNICNFTIQKMMNNLKMTNSQVEFSEEGINEIVARTQDKGARKTIENLRSVFKYIIQKFDTAQNNEKIVINKSAVTQALKNKQNYYE